MGEKREKFLSWDCPGTKRKKNFCPGTVLGQILSGQFQDRTIPGRARHIVHLQKRCHEDQSDKPC